MFAPLWRLFPINKTSDTIIHFEQLLAFSCIFFCCSLLCFNAQCTCTQKTTISVGKLRVSAMLLNTVGGLSWLTHYMSCYTWDCICSQKTWVCDRVLRAPCSASCSALMVVKWYGTELTVTAFWESREALVNCSTQESFWSITPPSSAPSGHICLGNGAAVGVKVEPGQPR